MSIFFMNIIKVLQIQIEGTKSKTDVGFWCDFNQIKGGSNAYGINDLLGSANCVSPQTWPAFDRCLH